MKFLLITYLETKTIIITNKTYQKKDERDVAKRMDELREDLSSASGLLFNGEPMSDEAKNLY